MTKSWGAISVSAATLACICSAALLWPRAASTESQQTPNIEEYNPKSTLVVKEHKIERAKFPFIDIHSHHWNPTPEHVDQLVKEMDTINLRVLVNLSGGTGEELRKTVATMFKDASVPEATAADILGHEIATMSYGVYAGNVSLATKAKAIAKLRYPASA